MAAWTSDDDAELKRLHAEGLPLNQIRLKMGRPRSTIGRHSQKLGLTYDREHMRPAIEAAQMDRKATRAGIIEDLYRVARRQTDRLLDETGFDTLINIGMGEQGPRRLDFIPAADARALAGSIGTLLARAEALEKIDADGGAGEVRGIVGGLLDAIAARAADINPIDVD